MADDFEKLHAYVERVFKRSGNTGWPTVRECARALRLRQVEIEELVEGQPDTILMLSSYLMEPPPPLGDYFVESLSESLNKKFEFNLHEHIAQCKREIKTWPQWMQDAAHYAYAGPANLASLQGPNRKRKIPSR